MEGIVQSGANVVNSILGTLLTPKETVEKPVIIREIQEMQPASRTFVRIAGFSGAVAVMMSAYGAHGKFPLRKRAYSSILKIYNHKRKKIQIKNSDIFHIPDQNKDCGYSLEPTRRGGSNEYPQSIFF